MTDMKQISFEKYQGAGNDFVLIDGRRHNPLATTDHALIARLCDRKFGIGADGLIILRKHSGYDFEMLYFNADGYPGSMCGNGGRCAVAFAHTLGMVSRECNFLAVDGPHRAVLTRKNWIELEMIEVDQIEIQDGFYFLDTGSPHYIEFVPDLDRVDVYHRGREIRYSDRFREKGTNVNFIEKKPGGIRIATYERGVENETLACGTGVTAAAIAHYLLDPLPANERVKVEAKGGNLEVRFSVSGVNHFHDIWLCGPAESVFKGSFPVR